MNITYSITSKNQVTIPKEVREGLKLKKGQGVRFVRSGNRYFIDPSPTIADVQKLNAASRRKKVVTQKDIDAAKQKFLQEGLEW